MDEKNRDDLYAEKKSMEADIELQIRAGVASIQDAEHERVRTWLNPKGRTCAERTIGVGCNPWTGRYGRLCRSHVTLDFFPGEQPIEAVTVLSIECQGADDHGCGLVDVGREVIVEDGNAQMMSGTLLRGRYQFLSLRDALIDLGDKLRRQRDSEE